MILVSSINSHLFPTTVCPVTLHPTSYLLTVYTAARQLHSSSHNSLLRRPSVCTVSYGQADMCTLRILPYLLRNSIQKYGNTDLLIWVRKCSSPKYGNAHAHLTIFFTVISCINNVAPCVGNAHVPLYYARCQATRNIH